MNTCDSRPQVPQGRLEEEEDRVRDAYELGDAGLGELPDELDRGSGTSCAS